MPRPAKILIVGTIAAIPLSLLGFTTATSQSTVTNNQVLNGTVFSSDQLDVVTQSSDTTVTATTTGNSFTGSVVTGDLDVQSSQVLNAPAPPPPGGPAPSPPTQVSDIPPEPVQAATVTNIASDAGPFLTDATAATGNTGQSVISGGGALTGSYSQTTSATTIDAESQINGTNATSTDVADSVQAIGNSQGFGTTGSTINTSVTQTNNATVTANGGAVLGDVSEQGSFTAIGSGNNVESNSADPSSQTLNVGQTNNGVVTQGAIFVNLGDSEVTDVSATATGNNASVTNTSGPLSVTSNQDNGSFVNAIGVETSWEYGGANVSAYGVGNSMLAGNVGPSVTVNNVQTNGASGVQSSASFSSAGSPGYDAFVSSSAIGNAATAFACSACGGVMNIQNSQANSGDIASTASLDLANPARSARATSTAVGNSATFYVTSPSH